MANKVISIEVGYSLTRVCEMDYQAKNPKVYHSFSLPTPEGVLEDGTIQVDETFVAALKGALKERKIRTKQVVVSLTSSKIASREVFIPMVKENRIADVVKANATEYFPIDVSQYQFAYTILGTETEVKGNSQYKLQVLAAPNAMLTGYKDLTTALELELVALDYNGNSLHNALKGACTEGTKLVIKVDERAALMMIVQDATIVLSRSIAYGIDEALLAVMEQPFFGAGTYEKALELCCTQKCIQSSMETRQEVPFAGKYAPTQEPNEDGLDEVLSKLESEPSEPSEEDKCKQAVTETFKYLIGGIGRVIDYYNSRHVQNPLDTIYLTGLGSEFEGLAELLTQELATSTQTLSSLEGFQLEKAFQDKSFGPYIGCIGAGVAPVDFISSLFETKAKLLGKGNHKEAKGQEKAVKDYDRICKLVMIGGLLIAVVLLVTSMVPYFVTKNNHKDLLNRIAMCEDAFPIYEEFLNAEASLEKIEALDATTKNQLENLTKFMTQLEQRMPSSFSVYSLTADANGLTMDVSVDTKAAAAKVISELKSFEMVEIVDVPSLMEQPTEIGEIQVSFSATIVFKSLEPETTEPVEQIETQVE